MQMGSEHALTIEGRRVGKDACITFQILWRKLYEERVTET